MATLKLTIDGRRNYSDGRVPIIYRLTHKTKTTRIDSGVKVFKQEWDSSRCRINKIHPEYKFLNILLNKRILELEKRLLEIVSINNNLDINALKQTLLNEGKAPKITFNEFAKREIQNLRDQGRFGNASVYETSVNRLIGFTGTDILFDKVDYNIISAFDAKLIKEGVSRNTIAIYMREIRALWNLGIKRKLVSRENYPFYDFKIKTTKTVNRAIKKEHLKILKELPLKEGSVQWHSRNIFFLIFYLIGISFLDLVLLKPEDIHDDSVVV